MEAVSFDISFGFAIGTREITSTDGRIGTYFIYISSDLSNHKVRRVCGFEQNVKSQGQMSRNKETKHLTCLKKKEMNGEKNRGCQQSKTVVSRVLIALARVYCDQNAQECSGRVWTFHRLCVTSLSSFRNHYHNNDRRKGACIYLFPTNCIYIILKNYSFGFSEVVTVFFRFLVNHEEVSQTRDKITTQYYLATPS